MTAFGDLHRPGTPLVLPNAWDFISAAALVDAGFPAVGTTSLGVAAANGRPDAEGETRVETVALVRQIATLPCLLTVDLEAGFGDPIGVAEEVAALGAVGINLEDGLGPIDRHADAIAAIKKAAPELFVNARTDTHWLQDRPDLDETLRRLTAYVEAGADGVFVPGLAEPDDIRRVVNAIDAPLNVLALAGGQTVAELGALGVARVSTGSLLFRAAVGAAVATAQSVARNAGGVTGLPQYTEIIRLVGERRSPGG
jgi:2-methylisocitrate lyase-like PEP mutase family enzyme